MPKEREIHEKGLVSVLKQIHDELDAAVFAAYGWPHDLSDEEILERLVALNHERAEEEKRGLIRWLRPEFQNPAGGKPSVQNELALEDESDDDEPDESSSSTSKKKPAAKKGKGKSTDAAAKKSTKETKSAWPKKLPEQIAAVRQALQSHKGPAAPYTIASRFKTVKPPAIEELLDTLVAVGQARQTKDGRYVV